MSAKFCARPVLRTGGGPYLAKCALRQERFLSTGTAQKQIQDGSAVGGTRATSRPSPSRWSGRNVFAVAATAGVLGWGVANWQQNGLDGMRFLPGFGSTILLDSGLGPKYASMSEMKRVRSFFCSFSVWTFCPWKTRHLFSAASAGWSVGSTSLGLLGADR